MEDEGIAAAAAQARALERQGWEALQSAQDVLSAALDAAEAAPGADAGRYMPDLWRLRRALQARHAAPHHFSQLGQDVWLDRHVFGGRRDGVFLDIGGYDGVTGSNTLFFELFRGWSGLLFEPQPEQHARAAGLRRCPCHCIAIGAEEGSAEFLHVERGYTQMSGLQRGMVERHLAVIRSAPQHRERLVQVPVRPLAPFLRESGIDRVDYVSLDVEGAEAEILESFPFATVPVTAWSVENPYGNRRIGEIMAGNGYRRIAVLGVDEIYAPA